MDEASLIWGLIFGCIGLGYFRYGKQQQRFMPYVCGIALMLFPYFVTGTVWLVLVGLILLALPFVLKY